MSGADFLISDGDASLSYPYATQHQLPPAFWGNPQRQEKTLNFLTGIDNSVTLGRNLPFVNTEELIV